MHYFSFGVVVGLLVKVLIEGGVSAIMTYLRLNTTKSVDDLTQHFLILSLCFNPKLLSS